MSNNPGIDAVPEVTVLDWLTAGEVSPLDLRVLSNPFHPVIDPVFAWATALVPNAPLVFTLIFPVCPIFY